MIIGFQKWQGSLSRSAPLLLGCSHIPYTGRPVTHDWQLHFVSVQWSSLAEPRAQLIRKAFCRFLLLLHYVPCDRKREEEYNALLVCVVSPPSGMSECLSRKASRLGGGFRAHMNQFMAYRTRHRSHWRPLCHGACHIWALHADPTAFGDCWVGAPWRAQQVGGDKFGFIWWWWSLCKILLVVGKIGWKRVRNFGVVVGYCCPFVCALCVQVVCILFCLQWREV